MVSNPHGETPSGAETPATERVDDPGDGSEEAGDTADDSETGGNSGDGSGPGFGVGSTLASLGGVGYLLKRRLSADESVKYLGDKP